MMNVLLQVTKDDIENGRRGSRYSCPVALAVNRALKPGCYCTIGANIGTIYNFDRLLAETFSVPNIVTFFVNRYDHSIPVEPFQFYVTLPEDALK